MGKRIKRVIIGKTMLMVIISQRSRLEVVVGIPPTANCVGTFYDPKKDQFTLLVQDQSFPLVPEGEEIPEFEVIVNAN